MKSELLIIRSYARVSAKLKERIATGEFEIGARLPPERELATFYDVSRPTIRETILALEIEGIVSVRRGSGVYVISKRSRLGMTFDMDVDLFELLQARRAIESEACALAAAHITVEQLSKLSQIAEVMHECGVKGDIIGFEGADRYFHLSIAEASANTAMSIAIVGLWDIQPLRSQIGILNDKRHDLFFNHDFNKYNAIIKSIKSACGNIARLEMQNYYNVLIRLILDDMEDLAVAKARTHIQNQRNRFIFGD